MSFGHLVEWEVFKGVRTLQSWRIIGVHLDWAIVTETENWKLKTESGIVVK